MKEFGRKPRISPANLPSQNKLCLCFNRYECPHAASHTRSGNRRCYVLFFAANKRPDFINLNPFGWDVAQGSILVPIARGTDLSQQPENRPFRYARQARRGANRATFDQGRDHRDFFLHTELVHTPSIRYRFRMSREKTEKCSRFLSFLGPSGFCGFRSGCAASFRRHRVHPAFTADFAALPTHLRHDLRDDADTDGFGFADGFQDYPASVLNVIQFWCASAFWHIPKRATERKNAQVGGKFQIDPLPPLCLTFTHPSRSTIRIASLIFTDTEAVYKARNGIKSRVANRDILHCYKG